MKLILTTIITTAFFTNAICQSQNSSKGFRSFEEFKIRQASLTINYPFIQRTEGNVFMKGGITNYIFKKIKSKELITQIEQELWGVEYNGEFYINAYPYSKIKGYNKFEEIGFYSYFIGEPARTLDEQRSLGIVGKDDPLTSVCCKVGYVMQQDGTIKLLSPTICRELISDNPELLAEFDNANLKMENVPEMFAFLKRYNEAKE
ncbi:MAG: hypothetical protein KDC79_11225 [Cyclobacteriaceae bacterium]|nr:hypothetical protein [Cyclobacteriaceae bacterium]